MDYYNEIKTKIIEDKAYSRVKDYSKEYHRVKTYYEIGEMLNNAGKHYGEGIIKEYSKKLEEDLGKKYSYRTLFRMKQFYLIVCDGKVSQSATLLSWSHWIELLSLKDPNEINYYINLTETQKLSRDKLRERIQSKEYERLPECTKNKLIKKENTNLLDLVPEPILIQNNENKKIYNEKVLHELILDHIEKFMNNLGSGYTFVGSEYPIKIEDNYNYIDILLFNYEFNAFVVVELKVTKLKKEHIGQIECYMNYIDKNVKKPFHNETIGIILVTDYNKLYIEYTSDKRIIARTYELV